MKKIKVYRFELNGEGPYSYDYRDFMGNTKLESAISLIHESIWGNNDFPDIFRDIKIEIKSQRIKRKIFTGCLSKEDLLNWFKRDIGNLKILGFAILEYTVDEKDVFYTKSGKQVGFKRGKHPFRVMEY